jgi:hypothetical protein
MKKIIAATLIMLSSTAYAAGEFDTGTSLLNSMNGNESNRSFAMGYVIGVHDSVSGIVICTPDNVTKGQVRDFVKIYLQNNTSKLSNEASELVITALKQVWPCRR